MNRDTIIEYLKDDASKLDSFINLSDIDKKSLTDRLSNLLSEILSVTSFNMQVILKGEKGYIAYKFRDMHNQICKAAIKCEDVSCDSIYNIIIDIIDGIDAIDILNDTISDSGNTNIDVSYKWGKAATASIAYWDFDSIKVTTDYNALATLLEQYRKGTGRYINWIKDSMTDFMPKNTVEFIRDFNKLSLNIAIGSTLQYKDIADVFTASMLSREEVLNTIRNYNNSSEKQVLKSVDVVDTLGRFLVMLNWNVDYVTKSIETSLTSDSVIDLDNMTIITSPSICSRLEQKLRVTDSEIHSIFKN